MTGEGGMGSKERMGSEGNGRTGNGMEIMVAWQNSEWECGARDMFTRGVWINGKCLQNDTILRMFMLLWS